MGGHLPPTQNLLRQLEGVPEWPEREPKSQVQEPPSQIGTPVGPPSMPGPVLQLGPGADCWTFESGMHLLQIPTLGPTT